MKRVLRITICSLLVLLLATGCQSQFPSSKDNPKEPEKATVQDSAANLNEIELTPENYSKYLSIEPFAYGVGDTTYLGGVVPIQEQVCVGVDVQGISQNFNYNDISLEIRVYGNYVQYDTPDDYYTQDYSFNCMVDCNIIGQGSASEFYIPAPDYNIGCESFTVQYEVLSVIGTVSPA